MADAKMLKKVPVREQDPKVRATNFEEVCLGYNQEEAMEEAQRCLGCKKPKCVEGCPVSINIPGFIEHIKEGNMEEAYKVIGLSSALPAICGRVCPQESQCEGQCIRGKKGEAVSIGKLERFVADYALEHDIKPAGAEVKNGHKVAVIGSGPSGLTCAGDLAKAGYDVTVFEALHELGGVLVYGIPEFRLPKQAVVQPEVMAIQKKYKNKKDQASMLKQQEEIQQVYDKYGVSMMGGCLPLLIQMPFLFALYPVIYSISDYVPNITAQANKFLTIPDMTITPGNMLSMAKSGETMGYSAAALVITAILLPVLSAFTQYLNMKLSMAVNGSNRPADKDDPTAATMRTMNMTMPLFSLVMVFTLPTGIGIYWIVSAIVRMVQQIFINKHLSKMSVDDMIEKNKEKAQKKKEKRGEKAEKINAMAQTNTKSIKSSATKSSSMSDIEREEKLEKARANAKPGSLASKANMVKNFNENKKGGIYSWITLL